MKTSRSLTVAAQIRAAHQSRSVVERGSALLAVLWLAAALAAIAFSIANTVRGETERTATGSEGLRDYYVAVGGAERAMVYMLWGPGYRNPDGSPKYWERGVPRLVMQFPSGEAVVNIIPEAAKFDINKISKLELVRLLLNLGADPAHAETVSDAIIDWRAPAPDGFSPFDGEYLRRGPTFRARHASVEEIEELLLVKGMTPELFYGGFVRDPQTGRLAARGGLRDCVSVYGSNGALDVNYAEPAVLATIGLSPAVIPALVERRRAAPFRDPQKFSEFAQFAGGPGFERLQVNPPGTIFTIRSSARIRRPDGSLSDLVRTVGALVKVRQDGKTPPLEVLRWYDN